ncbi:bifunctional metallophosphatase/5'-nucleotidase [Rhodobaculum claviforme]|uniref:Bifunctional metallophosphatase/5'-nucleotidase n=1 Tax=Rhodobaculum claviforme TaxID=1549854 RepID=A0A934TGB7_9RHOB|nr:5'-nucleotidase C-terminal domain-containing protein [Rhodobaculum claviforme]MBK5925840.1 bifunctional metallophosphatase/5'-nucleotidase [Rhodobaculum claviforme]
MPSLPPLSRRRFLVTAAAAAAALSPVLSFRAGAQAGPGTLLMVPAAPNPAGTAERVFVLHGDPLSGPITAIVTEDGNPVPAPVLADGERRVLRLMHFNDLHNHITEMHPARGNTHRMAQMVRRVSEARAAAAEDEVVLFVSGGDDHTGSVFDELLGWAPEEFVADAGYRAASAAGVDIAVLGNHEFDRGAEMLRIGIAADAAFPVITANVHGSAHLARDRDYVAAAVLEAKGLRVGFLGLTTQVDTRTGQPDDPGMAVASPVAAVRNVLPALAQVSDVVVILSHCGFGSGQHRTGKAGAARLIGEGDFDIAEAAGALTDRPVVLIGGHSHTALNTGGLDPDNVMDGVLMTQAEANGRYLGEIAMSIRAGAGRQGWFTHVGLHPIKRRDDRVAPDDPAAAALETDADYDHAYEAAHVAPLIAALEDRLAQTIGTVAPDADVAPARVIADRYMRETALLNFMNDALVARSRTFPGGPVDLALFNATAIITGLEAGPLSFGDWYAVMPYADQVHVARMTGAQIGAMLQSNAHRLVRPEEAADLDLGGFVSRGFLHFSGGLRYRIVPGADAAAARAEDITILGAPLEAVRTRVFTLAVNSYVQLGAFAEAWNGQPIVAGVGGEIAGMDLRDLDYSHTGLVYRNEIIAHIRDHGGIAPDTGARLDGRLVVG